MDFQAVIEGRVSGQRWDFGDGVVVSNRPYACHAWAVPGDYAVELRAYNESYPAGVSATVTVQVVEQPVHYVALGSANPVPPYSSWATAAQQHPGRGGCGDGAGALVLVTNGVYQTGRGRCMG